MAEGATVDLPLGFRFAAGYAGIRKTPDDDLALMVSDRPASAAGVFTRNAVRAAPVVISEGFLRESGGRARAIVANAGNANCATPNMREVSMSTARGAARLLGIPENQVLLASTGVIGEPFSPDRIPHLLPRLRARLDRGQFQRCAAAIMTTDTVAKFRSLSVETEHGPVRLAGMAKGAGMIMPDMATMLSFLFTDAGVAPDRLLSLLRNAVNASFNCVTVDSDTSTNDTVFLLANGASEIEIGDRDTAFAAGLERLTRELAIEIARDGEGASKLAEVAVAGAGSDSEAKTIALAIANSPLVKTALAGADPNWGRILGAAGKCGVPFDPAEADVLVNGVRVCKGGMRADFDEAGVQQTMEREENRIDFRIRGGRPGRATVWTCDFTENYVRINADYRT